MIGPTAGCSVAQKFRSRHFCTFPGDHRIFLRGSRRRSWRKRRQPTEMLRRKMVPWNFPSMMTGQTHLTCQDLADGALSSAAVTRPSASFLMPLRRAPRQPDPSSRVGVRAAQITDARCRGRSSGWRSVDLGFCQIKQETVGRVTFAEPSTAVPLAPTGLGPGLAKAICNRRSWQERCRNFGTLNRFFGVTPPDIQGPANAGRPAGDRCSRPC